MKLKFEKCLKKYLTREMVEKGHWYQSRENPNYYFRVTEPGTTEEIYEYREKVVDTSKSGTVLLANGEIKR